MKKTTAHTCLLNIVKLFIASISCLSVYCWAGPMGDFGESAGRYVGSCTGSEFVKVKYCPQLRVIPTEQCMQSVSQIMIQRYRTDFSHLMQTNLNEERNGVISDIDAVYLKLLEKNNGNRSFACTNFQDAISKMQYSDIEKMKMIVKYIK